MTYDHGELDILKQAELFAGVSESALEHIAEISEFRRYGQGEKIYSLGDDAEDIYVLASGRVRFVLHTRGRPISQGSIMTSRQVFGWAALISGLETRIATAECLEPSQVLAINGDRLMEVFEAEAKAGFLVMRRTTAMVARNFMDVGQS